MRAMRLPQLLSRAAVFRVLVWIIAICWATCSPAQDKSAAHDLSLGAIWPPSTGNEMGQSLRPGLGWSFSYDGQRVGPGGWTGWKLQRQGLATTLSHPSGLTAVCQARVFAEYGAVEYAVVFRNDGPADLPPLTDVKAIDVSFDCPAGSVDVATTCGGGEVGREFPPNPTCSFTLTRLRWKAGPCSIPLAASGGKCSRVALPFFYVQNQAQDAGLFIGLGWSGQWRAAISRDPANHRLRIEGGIADLDLKLKPGEQISGPTILLGCWRGSLDVGVNTLRRLIRDRYAPSLGGKRLVPPVMYTTWFQVGAELDEKMAGELIHLAAEMGQEIFEVDASWYNGTPTAPYTRMDITWKAISESAGQLGRGRRQNAVSLGAEALAARVSLVACSSACGLSRSERALNHVGGSIPTGC